MILNTIDNDSNRHQTFEYEENGNRTVLYEIDLDSMEGQDIYRDPIDNHFWILSRSKTDASLQITKIDRNGNVIWSHEYTDDI